MERKRERMMERSERIKINQAIASMVIAISMIEHDEKAHDYLMGRMRQLTAFMKKESNN